MPARKRAAAEVDSAPNRRRSGRISSTPKKSKYFEGSDDEASGAEDGVPPRKRGRPPKKLKNEESEEQYVDEDDEDDEAEVEEEDEDEDDDDEGVRKVVIKPLEQMRDTGGVDYEDQKVHKNSLLFLKDLKANNRREWLKCECLRKTLLLASNLRPLQHMTTNIDGQSRIGILSSKPLQ